MENLILLSTLDFFHFGHFFHALLFLALSLEFLVLSHQLFSIVILTARVIFITVGVRRFCLCFILLVLCCRCILNASLFLGPEIVGTNKLVLHTICILCKRTHNHWKQDGLLLLLLLFLFNFLTLFGFTCVDDLKLVRVIIFVVEFLLILVLQLQCSHARVIS